MASKVAADNTIDPRVMLSVINAVKRGDFSVRLPAKWTGNAGKVASALNDVIESNQRLERKLRKLGRHVGKGRPQRKSDCRLRCGRHVSADLDSSQRSDRRPGSSPTPRWRGSTALSRTAICRRRCRWRFNKRRAARPVPQLPPKLSILWSISCAHSAPR